MLVLRDLAADLDVRPVAGATGLGRVVRWAHSSELEDPTPWLSGGELLLTTGLPLDGAASQRAYVRRLDAAGVAGLGLGLGFGHDEVPEPLRRAADEAGLPVLEIPYAMPFIAVTERVAFHVLSRTAREAERGLAREVLNAEIGEAELLRRLSAFGLGDRVWALATRGDDVDGGDLATTAGGVTYRLLAGEEDTAVGERLRGDRPAGMGRAVAAADLRRTLLEAREALATDPTGLATFADLGSVRLLLSLQEDDSLRAYCDAVLGGLEDPELLRSLDAFIEANGQWERAAQRLDIHRHTLRHRIRRVQEETGRDLGSARDRIEFWLALRGRELTVTEEIAA